MPLNPKPLAPKWFYDLLFHSTEEMDVITEAFVQRAWEGLLLHGRHTCDPYFHIWELHVPTYFPGDGYEPDQR